MYRSEHFGYFAERPRHADHGYKDRGLYQRRRNDGVNPCFIVKRANANVFGYQSGNINGLPIYTDQAEAAEVIGSAEGLVLQAFASKDELVADLRGLSEGIHHVVLDPMDDKLAGFVLLSVFIQTLDAAELC